MCHIEISISESNLVPHKSLMHHDIQKCIFYHTFHLFFPIRHACGHVDVGTCPHQVLVATFSLFRPGGRADYAHHICYTDANILTM